LTGSYKGITVIDMGKRLAKKEKKMKEAQTAR
jgi:hypothetical protein